MLKEELDITPLKKALNTLKEGYNLYLENNKLVKEDILNALKDSCIKRFEYTYEMSKKVMSRYIKVGLELNIEDFSIINIFREMNSRGFIKNLNNWDLYRKQRNSTSHEYDIEISRQSFNLIPNFIEDIEYLICNLEEKLK